jgi:hypothetical protein
VGRLVRPGRADAFESVAAAFDADVGALAFGSVGRYPSTTSVTASERAGT